MSHALLAFYLFLCILIAVGNLLCAARFRFSKVLVEQHHISVALSVFCLQFSLSCRCRMRCSALHLLRCVRLRLGSRLKRNRPPLCIRRTWAYVKLLVHSLCFNSLTDSDVVFDSVFEPVFVTVDYLTRWFGLVSLG